MKTDLCKMAILMTTLIPMGITHSAPQPEDLPPTPPVILLNPNPFIMAHITTLETQIRASEHQRKIICRKMRRIQIILSPNTTPLVFTPFDPGFPHANTIPKLQSILASSTQNLKREQLAYNQLVACFTRLISHGPLPDPTQP
ncbi:MAG: hypothetical protein ACK5PQ_05030 [Alphaproteobacteria bacterium]